MKAIVIFTIGETEIKTTAGVPQSSLVQGEGRDNMVKLHAISQIRKDMGIDLFEIDKDIKEKAKIFY